MPPRHSKRHTILILFPRKIAASLPIVHQRRFIHRSSHPTKQVSRFMEIEGLSQPVEVEVRPGYGECSSRKKNERERESRREI